VKTPVVNTESAPRPQLDRLATEPTAIAPAVADQGSRPNSSSPRAVASGNKRSAAAIESLRHSSGDKSVGAIT
jgi:hypothetical protein